MATGSAMPDDEALRLKVARLVCTESDVDSDCYYCGPPGGACEFLERSIRTANKVIEMVRRHDATSLKERK